MKAQTKFLTMCSNYCSIEISLFVGQDRNTEVLKTIIQFRTDIVSRLKDPEVFIRKLLRRQLVVQYNLYVEYIVVYESLRLDLAVCHSLP